MSAKPFQVSLIPVYIFAKSKDELILKMLQTNGMNQKMYNYQTPYPVKGGYEVWYYTDVFVDKHIDNVFDKDKI